MRHQPTPEQAPASEAYIDLPEFMDPGDFVKSVDALPIVLTHGLPKDHHDIYFADRPRNDLKQMGDAQLVLRSDSNAVECTLRAFQRGYDFTKVTKVAGQTRHQAGSYIGAIEAQVLGAAHRGYSVPQQEVVRTVEAVVEPYVQEAIRDRLFERAKEMSQRTVDELSHKEFVEIVAAYNPDYDFGNGTPLASQLAKQIYDFRASIAGRRGQAPIVERRLDEIFHAIGSGDRAVQNDKRTILQHGLINQIDHPRRILDRAAARLTGKPRPSMINELAITYGESFDRLGVPLPDIGQFYPRPGAAQETLGRTALETARLAEKAGERISQIDPAKATRTGLSFGLAAGAIGFGANTAAAAAPERATTSITLNVENVSLPTISVAEKSSAKKEIVYDARAEKALDAMTAVYERRGDHAAVRATHILRFFMKKGLPLHQAAGGPIGSFGVESAGKYDPNINQYGGGPGRGIAQWEEHKDGSGRWNTMLKWAHKHNRNPRDLDTQLDFSMHELNGTEKFAFGKLKNTTNLHDAVYAFTKFYERPGHPSVKWRLKYAQRYYDDFMAHYDGAHVIDDNNHGNTGKPHPKAPLLDTLSLTSILDGNTAAAETGKPNGDALESVLAFTPETAVTLDHVLPSIDVHATRARLSNILGIAGPSAAEDTSGILQGNGSEGLHIGQERRAALEDIILPSLTHEDKPPVTAPIAIDLSSHLGGTALGATPEVPAPEVNAGNPSLVLGGSGTATAKTPEKANTPSALPQLDMAPATGPDLPSTIELSPISLDTANSAPNVINLADEESEDEGNVIDLAQPVVPDTPAPTPSTAPAPKAAAPKAPAPVKTHESHSIPKGSAEEIAKKLVKYIEKGKISCNNQANNCPDIQKTAIGKSLKGIGSCNANALDAQMLGTLLKLVEEGHDVVLSSICSDHPSNPRSQHKLGKALDFNVIDGTFMGAAGNSRWTGSRATAGKELLRDVSAIAPAGTGFGQQQCHPAYAFMQDKGFRIYQDPCHHQHVQLPGAASEND